MDVLKLSYDYLPRRLKPCFLYLGIYPEDYEIPAKELIQLWIAEGFIQPHESGTPNAPEPEDVGEDYLGELVDRSLIQVTSTRSYGGVKTCKVHDLLRELCILESKANNSLEVFTESNIHANNTSNPHRLSFLCNAQSYVSSVKPDTRSLFFFAGAGRTNCKESCLKNFQSIQVLHLQDQVYFTLDSNDLETMIHLKYLRLKRPANRKVYVPYYIWNLPKLETLDLEVWAPFTILDGFWKLDRLRHVYVRCSTKLPPAAPQAPTILWNLQTLYGVALDQTIASLFSNNIFPNLRKLALQYGSRKDETDSLFSRFSKKKIEQACTSDYSSATLHELLASST
ncbi:toMV resistant protein Tm-2 netted virescent-like [Arachis duranensis]|uniref:ToMV resistant protein Tm-2 netted virescent-like n=1 Tax=Arachis duranensis TaxID=130453 RepID=A0A9C6WTD3_ARADU|nr:toMV resistant protein Tm-2 netted virescent-like [Arachis duranensis]